MIYGHIYIYIHIIWLEYDILYDVYRTTRVSCRFLLRQKVCVEATPATAAPAPPVPRWRIHWTS